MARQFKRVSELIVTPPDGPSRVISGLKISFVINKSVISTPNLAQITVHNPNDETLSTMQRKFTRVTFNAGYVGNKRLLFTGQIRNVLQGRAATERTATIYSGDGQQAWQNARINKTYAPNVNMKTVIRDLISTFTGTTEGDLEGIPNVPDKLLGQTYSGSSKDVLDELATEYGFDWSIQDGVVVTTPKNSGLTSTQAVLINRQTGMLNSPTLTEIGADVTTLLNPLLLPNTLFRIESQGTNVAIGNLNFRELPRTKAEGLYKVLSVEFKGDNRQGDWTSTVVGRRVSS